MPKLLLASALLSLGLVAACGDGQSLIPDADGDGIPDDRDPDSGDGGGDGGGGGGGGIGGDPDLPPGTDSPSASDSITRFEDDDGQGGGYVTTVDYDAATDTFGVDNLGFDGDNVYTRDDDVATLSTSGSPAVYAVYEASNVEFDDDGDPIAQFDYRAIYGVSDTTDEDGNPTSRFAIVRTGSYIGYGFGGFIYEREGGVDLPTTGQATYAGEYAGLRVYQDRAGMDYTRGDVDIAVDFRDFNDGNAVQGVISGREAFDLDGNPIAVGTGEGELALPDLVFAVGPGVMTDDGEITGDIRSNTEDENGVLTAYEEGTYYGIIGGEGASEIVGIFVVESQDPRFGVTAQETGGFIVYR